MGQKITSVRVVVDTNVLVSGLLFGGEPGRLRDLWVAGQLVPLLSRETFAEFNRVLSYPKFRLSPAEITLLIEEELLPYAEVVDVTEDASGACRDPHDDMFLSLAVSGKALYVITGDRDLLVLNMFRQTRIITVSELLELM
ncbi:MAG: putative toxin-antitoxin system toxin component, PIN family [Steroidobacteraceae bacterium]|nr:putative toxin-antitoxin system toxin component, PIN family [Deltaproteobacteria bacterium]